MFDKLLSLVCRLSIDGDANETTLADFFAANAETFDWRAKAWMTGQLWAGRRVSGGGGAAPAWTLERLP